MYVLVCGSGGGGYGCFCLNICEPCLCCLWRLEEGIITEDKDGCEHVGVGTLTGSAHNL